MVYERRPPRPRGRPLARPSNRPQPRAQREPPGLASRRAALDVLTLVRDGRTLDEALDECRSFAALEGADRGFARAMVSTTLRRQGSIDALIGRFMDTPLPARAQKATDILRLAAAQTAFMDVSDHAAVSVAVSLARQFREAGGYAALINAVARKTAALDAASLEGLPERADTPGWLWRSWERAYGPARARALALAHRAEPPLDLTLRNPAEAELLAKNVGGSVLPTGSVRIVDAGPVAALSGFAEGAWWVQDAAAALPASLAGDVAGKDVLDLCAAPGGKTLQLAAAGGKVTAVDSVGPRLKRLQENLARTGLAAETVKADVLTWEPGRLWPVILLDAPCTATGTLRRRPDVAWSLREDDVATMARVQARMLSKAASWLEQGGTLIYATCSLQPEEGERCIAAFLESRSDFQRAPIAAEEIGGLREAVTADGDLRTLPCFWPDRGGLDGFFASRLTKD